MDNTRVGWKWCDPSAPDFVLALVHVPAAVSTDHIFSVQVSKPYVNPRFGCLQDSLIFLVTLIVTRPIIIVLACDVSSSQLCILVWQISF